MFAYNFYSCKLRQRKRRLIMCLEQWKTVTEIIANAAILIGGLWAVYRFSKSKKLERAKWLKDLYEKFYEKEELKQVRDKIDQRDHETVRAYVKNEPSEFTDYLNFFEFVGYLRETKQILDKEILGLFDYYLRNLKDEPLIRKYLGDKSHGYEKLRLMLEELYQEK